LHLVQLIGIITNFPAFANPIRRDIPMTSETKFCYHCRAHHPVAEMRQIETKAGKRWRCIRSIRATNISREERDAFGRRVSEMNSAESRSHARRMNELRQDM
jgi:hypothetical protein